MRLCYQSYVDYENGARYLDALKVYLDGIVDSGTTIDIK